MCGDVCILDDLAGRRSLHVDDLNWLPWVLDERDVGLVLVSISDGCDVSISKGSACGGDRNNFSVGELASDFS